MVLSRRRSTASKCRYSVRNQAFFAKLASPGSCWKHIKARIIERLIVPQHTMYSMQQFTHYRTNGLQWFLAAIQQMLEISFDVRIVLFVRLTEGLTLDEPLRERIRKAVRARTSPHHVPKVIYQVKDIPRTISNKISEIAVRETIHGRPVKNTDALANPGSLDEYRAFASN